LGRGGREEKAKTRSITPHRGYFRSQRLRYKPPTRKSVMEGVKKTEQNAAVQCRAIWTSPHSE